MVATTVTPIPTAQPPFSTFPFLVHPLHANVSRLNIIQAESEYEIVWDWKGKRRPASTWCFLLRGSGVIVIAVHVMQTNFEYGYGRGGEPDKIDS